MKRDIVIRWRVCGWRTSSHFTAMAESHAAASGSECVCAPVREAFATLVTSDSFVVGAEVLAFSLRRAAARAGVPARPVWCLVAPEVGAAGQARLRAAGMRVVGVPPLPNPHAESTHVPGWAACGFVKLRVWQLALRTCVYVDADAVALEPLEELFALFDDAAGRGDNSDDLGAGPFAPVGAIGADEFSGDRAALDRALLAAAPDVFPPDKFNAGVLVLRPSQRIFRALLRAAGAGLPSYDGGDTGFLNACFPQWFSGAAPGLRRLPFAYNALRVLQWFTKQRPQCKVAAPCCALGSD